MRRLEKIDELARLGKVGVRTEANIVNAHLHRQL